MRVLLISIFHPELVRGGAQQVAYELFQGLRDTDGVHASFLAAVDDSMPALFKSGARITGFDGRPDEYLFLSREYDPLWHKCGNPMLAESYADMLRQLQPDVVHVHHFLLFGVDLLTLTRRVLPHARIVLTLHEFMSICMANGHMVRTTDRSLCTHASIIRCHQCFPEHSPDYFFVREMWMKRHLDAVDVFTTPSRFMIEHYARWGLERDRIRHVPNGQRNYAAGRRLQLEPRAKRNRFGFFGQFVDSKGVHVLLRAVELLRADGFTDFTVELNGDNLRYASAARKAEFEAFAEQERERPAAEQNVVFAGSYDVDQLAGRMSGVDWCIVPSVWWEIFGLVISEAWMFKRPVIASDVGGMAERVTHERDGLLFSVGDPRSLAATIRRAATEDGLWDRLMAGITPPLLREEMTARFLSIYREGAASAAAA